MGDFHFNPTTKITPDYSYDVNGNLISDNNKAIDYIKYNFLNLADTVHMSGKGNIDYIYDAGGTRWKKIITDSLSRHSTTILYIEGKPPVNYRLSCKGSPFYLKQSACRSYAV